MLTRAPTSFTVPLSSPSICKSSSPQTSPRIEIPLHTILTAFFGAGAEYATGGADCGALCCTMGGVEICAGGGVTTTFCGDGGTFCSSCLRHIFPPQSMSERCPTSAGKCASC